MKRASLMLIAAAVAIAVALPGCGVQVEDSPRPIGDRPSTNSPSPVPTAIESGPVAETLYLVKDTNLVKVERRLTTVPTAEELLRDLATGPTQEEQDAGLTSALLGSGIVVSVQVVDGVATVNLTGEEETGRPLDVLAFGQIVCTLGDRPGIGTVTFTRDGKPIGVPKGDGVVTQDPLTPADYANLLPEE